MTSTIPRFIVADPYQVAHQVELYTRILERPDEPAMVGLRCHRVIYRLPVNRDALLAWLHQAHTQYRLLAERGEAA